MGLDVYAYQPEGNVYNFAPMSDFEGNPILEGKEHPNFRFSQPIRQIFRSIAGIEIEEGIDLSNNQINILVNYLRVLPSIPQYPDWYGEGVRQFLLTCQEKGYTVSIV